MIWTKRFVPAIVFNYEIIYWVKKTKVLQFNLGTHWILHFIVSYTCCDRYNLFIADNSSYLRVSINESDIILAWFAVQVIILIVTSDG